VTRDLTSRQLAIVQAHLWLGTQGAADKLGISRYTVKSHLAAARARMGVKTEAQLVCVLMQRGRLTPPKRVT
jgi:DNA-binding NarL/FixJ family response regulator